MNVSKRIKKRFVKFLDPFVDNYTPRSVIFLIDIIIAFISANMAFLLVASIDHGDFDIFHFPWQLWVIVGIQAVFFAFFRSYAGLIRYSSLHDAWKLLKVVFFCVAGLLVINQVYYFSFDQKIILNAGLIIYGVFAFSLLFMFRVFIKGVYEIIMDTESSHSAYILGVSREDVAMASGLMSQKAYPFTLVGFINDNSQVLKNDIFGLPIYNIERLKKRRRLARAVIVSEEKLKRLQHSDTTVLSELLDLRLKIFKLPTLQDWDDTTGNKPTELKEIKINDLLQRSPIKLNNTKLSSTYKGKTVLVTGAAGSIGSEIVRQLTYFYPSKIVLVDQAETPLHELTLELDKNYPKTNYEKVIGNVRNKKRMNLVFKAFKPQVVFHAAAYKHVPMMEVNAIEAISVNFFGTRNIATLADEHHVERFVFVSTDKAVNPTNIMGATKRSAELMIQYLSHRRDIKTNFITTRFGNVLGSNGSVVPYFKKQIAAGGPVTVTHPDIIRYFMTIDEACQLVLVAGGMGKGGEIFVFDMGSPVKIHDLAKHMIRLSGLIPDKEINIEFTGLRPGEKLYEELLADKESTQPTPHEKIMIGRSTTEFSDEELEMFFKDLLCQIDKQKNEDAVEILKRMVPEYRKEAIEKC